MVRRQWAESHFGSAEAAIGKTITVYGLPRQIVGVAARGFSYPGVTDIWSPAHESLEPQRLGLPRRRETQGRVDLAQAKAQMQAIGDNLARQYPENRFKTVALIPLQDRLTGDVKIMLWLLLGAVSVVLLIACANIANLQLARSAARTREIALRAALGAGRGRVMRQLLTENCVLMGLATCAGLILAAWLIRGLTALSPADLPRLDEVRSTERSSCSRSGYRFRQPAFRSCAGDPCYATRSVGGFEDRRIEGRYVRGQRSTPSYVRRGGSRPVRHLTGGRRVAAAIVSGAPAGGYRVHHGARARGLYPVPRWKR